MDKAKTCCFSGHRHISAEHFIRLPELLSKELDSLVEKGFSHFKAGGAIGFDTLATLKCLELKNKYPSLNITIELCLPCKDQTSGWNEQDKCVYNFILKRVDKVTYECESYVKGCMYARNRRLVDNSDICIAYLTSDIGGTAYTCSYAKQTGVRVINLYDQLI